MFVPSKIAILVPEFAEEDLPLDRTATLVPEFAVKDLLLGQNTLMMMITSWLLKQPEVHYLSYITPPLVPRDQDLSSLHHLPQIHFNIILPPESGPL